MFQLAEIGPTGALENTAVPQILATGQVLLGIFGARFLNKLINGVGAVLSLGHFNIAIASCRLTGLDTEGHYGASLCSSLSIYHRLAELLWRTHKMVSG